MVFTKKIGDYNYREARQNHAPSLERHLLFHHWDHSRPPAVFDNWILSAQLHLASAPSVSKRAKVILPTANLRLRTQRTEIEDRLRRLYRRQSSHSLLGRH